MYLHCLNDVYEISLKIDNFIEVRFYNTQMIYIMVFKKEMFNN